MWQSFTAIGQGTAEGSWRKKKKERKKKHHEHFIRPPVTTYGRPNKPIYEIDRTGQTDTIYTIHIDTDYRVLQKTHKSYNQPQLCNNNSLLSILYLINKPNY